MAGMGGFECVRSIRQTEEEEELEPAVIIGMSSRKQREIKKEL
eukprot:CAMPEP_0202979072 /NCGR_PEP_ID=MMETSP1396-20130829/85324_1 /ASSEMBLY_ACC=CAM_ASM_000872 /TAXON_ID= /ORGANISM="Pseudokeronopsis sp., Strain Brazil" /LENGTH=42 /DNA_ID= /DNA_START= /DNA_END= /DNA_ORIENTATION=